MSEVLVCNVSAGLVLVGHQYLLAGERRRVARHDYETARQRYPAALAAVGEAAEPEESAEAEPVKGKSKNKRRSGGNEAENPDGVGDGVGAGADGGAGLGAGD